MSAPKPATPLPWIVNQRKHICAASDYRDVATTADGRKTQVAIDDAAYIAHAANNLPRLVAALRDRYLYATDTEYRVVADAKAAEATGGNVTHEEAQNERDSALLRDLGELE